MLLGLHEGAGVLGVLLDDPCEGPLFLDETALAQQRLHQPRDLETGLLFQLGDRGVGHDWCDVLRPALRPASLTARPTAWTRRTSSSSHTRASSYRERVARRVTHLQGCCVHR